ncbi:MAG: hypothetical protein ACD_2C00031G0002 [uncultured bacterium (gcode 4)]|uniref:FMN dependent NADH:quinone oxidoreductase n=1 Tax=uncultured bacterium (gcode 4) TaxID=1234023 RepID=K2FGD4_9BACT|nr:MAG: hypothetical protein ACD_2C00031G0002 [uncultured bacterium (gcode 4)]
MKTLYVIASPRWEMSKSIDLWNHLIDKLEGKITILDVNKELIPYITPGVVAMNYWYGKYEELSEEDKIIADLQEKYIAQIKESDNIVIATPMWNFWMPAALKSWFDLVIKINDTFSIEDWAYKGLVWNIKKAIIVWARWWKYVWTPYSAYDQLTPHINGLLGFIWIANPANFWLEGINASSDEELSASTAVVKNNIDEYMNNL